MAIKKTSQIEELKDMIYRVMENNKDIPREKIKEVMKDYVNA